MTPNHIKEAMETLLKMFDESNLDKIAHAVFGSGGRTLIKSKKNEKGIIILTESINWSYACDFQLFTDITQYSKVIISPLINGAS
jgi:hypothetical protein